MKQNRKIVKGLNLLSEAPKSLAKQFLGKETWQMDNREKLLFAIKYCRRIRITYDDKKGGKGKRTRYLFPLVFGKTKNGKEAIRSFQTAGSTKRGTPAYKLFLFDNIGYIDVGRVKYNQYEQMLLSTGFNPSGDKSFSEIYAITPLAREFNSANLSNVNMPIDSGPTLKADLSEPAQKSQPVSQPSTPQAEKNRTVSVDNSQRQNYTSKIEAPAPEPVTKSDIGQTTDNSGNEAEKIYAPETVPVTKSDVGSQEINRDNKLTQSYNDMMKRMDNLYSDEDEEENED